MQEDDTVVSLSDYGTVDSVIIVDAVQTMYDLTVEEVHTFAVGDGDWIVHNQNNPFTYNDNGLITGINRGALGGNGVPLSRALTIQELVNLYAQEGVEFGLGNEVRLQNGLGGNWFLYDGDVDRVGIPLLSPNGIPQKSVIHIHPTGNQVPSTQDLANVTAHNNIQLPNGTRLQNHSYILPITTIGENLTGRAIPYYPNTAVNDYFPGGQHSQYYHSGSANYLDGC